MKLNHSTWMAAGLLLCVAGAHAQINNRAQATRINTGNSVSTVITLQPVADGEYFIRINQTGKYFGIEGINPNNGARVVEWDFANQANHRFVLRKTSEPGCYTIMAVHSNRFLGVEGGSVADGTRIIQWDYAEADNMKWYILKAGDGFVLRSKQSGKEMKLAGAANNAENGTPLLLNGNQNAQVFAFVPVTSVQQTMGGNGNPLSSAKPDKVNMAKRVVTSVDIRLPGGATVTRILSNDYGVVRLAPRQTVKRVLGERQSSATCITQTAKIDMGPQENVQVSASDYILNNAPGLMYDIKTFYAGDYRDKELQRYGENRNPVVLTTTVRNIATSISDTVEKPTLTSVNQAISNMYNRFTSDPAKTGSQSFTYYASALENTNEFYMKLGASAHYFGGSVQAAMAVGNKQLYKSLYFEAVKELFTIKARPVQQGFFSAAVPGAENMGFISQADYGVKIIGKIEVKNEENSMQGQLKLAYEAGFAGGSISIETLSRESTGESKVFLYVIGGTSNTVSTCTLNNIQSAIDNIVRNVNYQTAMPLRVQFSTFDGQPVKYTDVTNNFEYDRCIPPVIAAAPKDVTININQFQPIGNDCDLYGDIWIELVSPRGGNLARFRNGNNRLFNATQTQVVRKIELMNYKPNLEVKYQRIPPELMEGAEIHIYYVLKDADDLNDDLLEQRNGHKAKVKNPNAGLDGVLTPFWEFFRSEIRLTGVDKQGYETEFVDRGDGVKISFAISNLPSK